MERIVQLYWDRDESAIVESDKKYGAYCTSIAVNNLRNPADAEECVNDTWLRAWNAMPPHRPSILSAFPGKLTRNLSFDRYRAAHREKRGGHRPRSVEKARNYRGREKSAWRRLAAIAACAAVLCGLIGGAGASTGAGKRAIPPGYPPCWRSIAPCWRSTRRG